MTPAAPLVCIGITICEDIWTEEYLQRPLYERDPAEELAAKGIDLLLNLSASPFHVGKPAERREMLGRELHSNYGPTADTGGLMQHHAPTIYAYPTLDALLEGETAGGRKTPLPARSANGHPVTERPGS